MEVWKYVKEYEGLYKVSNLGRVKSLERIKMLRGKYPYVMKEKILKLIVHSTGYMSITLYKNNNQKSFKIHQLVAISFLNHTACGYKLVVDHINDNPLDNRVENLQVVTARYNAYKTQNKYSSKYKGVSWCKTHNKWKSRIMINKKSISLGYFKNEKEAWLAYINKLNEYEAEEM